MLLDISKLPVSVENSIRLCRDSARDINVVKEDCRASAVQITSLLKQLKLTDGSRLSPRSLDKLTPDQLKSLVSTLFEQLQTCKEHFRLIPDEMGTVTNFIDNKLPELLTSYLHHSKSYTTYTTLDERLNKIDKFVDNIEPKLQHLENIETTCNELKSQISTLSVTEPSTIPLPELNQHHQSQMKELEDLKAAIASLPPPSPPPPPPIIDWTNIKFPPLPKVTKQEQDTAVIRKEVRLSQDIQLRKNNVVLRGLPVSVQANDPLVSAKSFLANCGIDQYRLCQTYLVSAFYLNRRDGHCTIRMIFSDQWTADHILELAYQLKSGTELYRGVYLDKDRTEDEMKAHRTLVAELRKMREDHPTIRWIIRNGTIMNKGPITKAM